MSEFTPRPDASFIDSHAHLDARQFDADRDEVIRRAEAALAAVINVSVDVESSRRVLELAHKHPFIYAAAGIHPEEAGKASEADIKQLSIIARDPAVVAIGEIGLDFYRDYAPKEQQVRVLKWQLELADEVHKPVVIHCRQAEKEMMEVLTDWRAGDRAAARPASVIHCFNGTLETANAYLRLGFYISLGAYIGYPSSKAMREVVKALPLDKLLIETDCPYLPPQNRRGQRNEPAYVVETAKELAAVKGISLIEIANQTTMNAKLLFGIPERRK